ncbi:MAG: hypothetical protein Q4A01_11040 [Coriobacteriales bacterium]|nr:hypothetical protein [Coriobacteriales bacterium]
MELLTALLKLAAALVALATAIITFRSITNGSRDRKDNEEGR